MRKTEKILEEENAPVGAKVYAKLADCQKDPKMPCACLNMIHCRDIVNRCQNL